MQRDFSRVKINNNNYKALEMKSIHDFHLKKTFEYQKIYIFLPFNSSKQMLF